MWKSNPLSLDLSRAASNEIIWHCTRYTGRGVMKFYESQGIGVSLSARGQTHEEHCQAAKNTKRMSGKTDSGKEFYHTSSSAPR